MALSGLGGSARKAPDKHEKLDDKEAGHSQPTHSYTLKSFSERYVLSCTAATVSETVTYPLDLTKTRLQIQGEKARYMLEGGNSVIPQRGFFGTTFGIVQEEGFFKLWQGLSPAIYRHIIYTGCRMAFYEFLRESVLGKNKDGSFPFWKAVMGGLMAGGFGQFLASPADLVKVQMQAEGRRRLEGKAPRINRAGDGKIKWVTEVKGNKQLFEGWFPYDPIPSRNFKFRAESQLRMHNEVKGPWHAFSKILREGGVRGLWKGWVPNVQRAALVNMGDLTTYDTAKQFILTHTSLVDNPLTHFLSSCCAGLVSASLGTPADVVKTRVMNQPTKDGRGVLYRSSIDCLIKTVRAEGFFALYKGFFPIWARMAPWSLIFWLSYEQIRRVAGVKGF